MPKVKHLQDSAVYTDDHNNPPEHSTRQDGLRFTEVTHSASIHRPQNVAESYFLCEAVQVTLQGNEPTLNDSLHQAALILTETSRIPLAEEENAGRFCTGNEIFSQVGSSLLLIAGFLAWNLAHSSAQK